MVVIGMYAGDWVIDARRDQRKPSASVYGVLPTRGAQALAAHLQAAAGGHAAHVIYLTLPWETAIVRYALTV